MKKTKARMLAKHKREQMDDLSYKIKSKIITQKIENHPKFIKAKVVGIYFPIKGEVNINYLNLNNKKVLFPKINKNNQLDFLLISNKTKWEINKYGIKEPKNGKIMNEEIDLLIIPSLAKNSNNYRLGYGKGYYDKFIKKYYPLYTMGILFDNYTLEFVSDIWDMKLDEFISN